MKLQRKAGFTLVEVLLVVAIIALLASLIFPIMTSARSASKRAVCTSQLRQVGMAISMYEETAGGMPLNLDSLTGSGVLRDTRMLSCPSDVLGGYASRFDECQHKPVLNERSYETMLDFVEPYKAKIQRADPNHGVVVCRMHGNKTELYDNGLANFCDMAWFMFEGTLLRLRKDNSVQVAHLKFRAVRDEEGRRYPTVGVWELYTDVPEPPDEP